MSIAEIVTVAGVAAMVIGAIGLLWERARSGDTTSVDVD